LSEGIEGPDEMQVRRVRREQARVLETAAAVCSGMGEHGLANQLYGIIGRLGSASLQETKPVKRDSDGRPDGWRGW
jgi:hypothetical protein